MLGEERKIGGQFGGKQPWQTIQVQLMRLLGWHPISAQENADQSVADACSMSKKVTPTLLFACIANFTHALPCHQYKNVRGGW